MMSLSAGRAAGDGCWVAYADQFTGNTGGIAQLKSNSIFHTLTFSNGAAYGVSATGPNDVWVAQSQDGAYHYTTSHFTFTATAGSTLLETRLLSTESGPLDP